MSTHKAARRRLEMSCWDINIQRLLKLRWKVRRRRSLEEMLTHQWASFNHAEFERADAKSAFPQGDGKEMQETAYVFFSRALHEIAGAKNIPVGSAVQLSKAVYGLGNAPRSW